LKNNTVKLLLLYAAVFIFIPKKYIMQFSKSFTNEFTHESASTRKLLECVPLDNPTWKPHEKSMPIHDLAVHIADIPNWVSLTLEQDELDFAKGDYRPKRAANTAELLSIHDEAVEKALKILSTVTHETLLENWTMRNGKQVYFTQSKIATLRGFVFNHLYHHRGQMTVYLRLLNIAVPGMYGPTADEQTM